MASEAVNGLSRLRNAAVLSAVAQLLFLLMSLPGEVPETPDTLPPWALVAGLLVLSVVIGVPTLVAWIFRVLGWWNMRKSGWRRRFYTVVWLTVTFGSAAAFLLITAGVVITVLDALPSLLAGGALTIPPLALPFIAAGILIVVIASIIEGVASLDVGLLAKAKPLIVGSAVYVAAALALLLPEGLIVASAVSLVANVLLAIGFHKTRKVVVAREAQREAANLATLLTEPTSVHSSSEWRPPRRELVIAELPIASAVVSIARRSGTGIHCQDKNSLAELPPALS